MVRFIEFEAVIDSYCCVSVRVLDSKQMLRPGRDVIETS